MTTLIKDAKLLSCTHTHASVLCVWGGHHNEKLSWSTSHGGHLSISHLSQAKGLGDPFLLKTKMFIWSATIKPSRVIIWNMKLRILHMKIQEKINIVEVGGRDSVGCGKSVV